jgi:transposase
VGPEQQRGLVTELLEQGMKPARVAQAVGTSRASVRRWRQVHERGGDAALAAKRHPGKPPRLSPKQRARLAKLLLRGARKHGYATDLWTLARVPEVCKRQLGIGWQTYDRWRIGELPRV